MLSLTIYYLKQVTGLINHGILLLFQSLSIWCAQSMEMCHSDDRMRKVQTGGGKRILNSNRVFKVSYIWQFFLSMMDFNRKEN